jgi:hypothetical protein
VPVRRRIIGLPPGGQLRIGPDGRWATIPLWLYWLQISRAAALASRDAAPSDAMIDALSARIAGQDVPLPDEPERGNLEIVNAMVAISAATHAIDGSIGALLRSSSRQARERAANDRYWKS